MTEITHRTIEANGIRIHLAEAGEGPLVVLCQGFPESWYSWRWQLPAFAEAGYRAVAPDMRGYGQTDGPDDIRNTRFSISSATWSGSSRRWDRAKPSSSVMTGARRSPGTRPSCGPTFSAGWSASAYRSARAGPPPTSVMPQTDQSLFYMLYFQPPGVAEAELERDPRRAVRRLLCSGSGDAPRWADNVAGREAVGMVPRSGGFLTRMIDPPELPAWLSEADIEFYAGVFAETGFRGGLNWYRNIDRNWELMAPFAGARVTVPALYVAGDRDLVVAFPGADKLIANLKTFVPDLRRTIMLPGCGHWTQQERANDVNAAIVQFCATGLTGARVAGRRFEASAHRAQEH